MAYLEASASQARVARRPAALRWVFPSVSLAIDLILVNLAFALSYWLRYEYGLGGTGARFIHVPFEMWLRFELLLTVLVPAALAIHGLYRQRLGLEWLGEMFSIARAATLGMAVAIIVTFLVKDLIDEHSRLVLLYTWVLMIAFCGLGRGIVRTIMIRLHRRGWNVRRVLVAGSADVSKMVMQNLSGRVDQGYRLVGFLHENGGAPAGFGRFPNLGSVATAAEVIDQHEVDEVVIALGSTSHEDILAIRDHWVRRNVAFKIVPDLFEMSLARVRMDDIAGIPLIDVVESPLQGANLVLKRLIDVLVSLLVLTVCSPFLALVALAIRLDSPGPIIIGQSRVGRHGDVFTCYKFRSMHEDAEKRHAEMQARYGADEPIFKLRKDPRRTRVGSVIRKLSIDESLQLINVLRGEMSLVGPRPALPIEVARYEPWHRKRLDALPGMTGLWQVSGRSHLNFDEMVIMDTYYIDNWSLALDLKILLRTPLAVLSMRGAY